jgi:D-isomer specific 2-hydroxyacid dehydrogenase, catalytic domain
LLGSVSGELGLRRFVEERGHRLVVTSDKEGPDSVLERELPEAEIVISQPFWPAYLTAERIAKAPHLKLAVTVGISSDHVDIDAAIERDVTVAEVTYSNSISVSERDPRGVPDRAGRCTRRRPRTRQGPLRGRTGAQPAPRHAYTSSIAGRLPSEGSMTITTITRLSPSPS